MDVGTAAQRPKQWERDWSELYGAVDMSRSCKEQSPIEGDAHHHSIVAEKSSISTGQTGWSYGDSSLSVARRTDHPDTSARVLNESDSLSAHFDQVVKSRERLGCGSRRLYTPRDNGSNPSDCSPKSQGHWRSDSGADDTVPSLPFITTAAFPPSSPLLKSRQATSPKYKPPPPYSTSSKTTLGSVNHIPGGAPNSPAAARPYLYPASIRAGQLTGATSSSNNCTVKPAGGGEVRGVTGSPIPGRMSPASSTHRVQSPQGTQGHDHPGSPRLRSSGVKGRKDVSNPPDLIHSDRTLTDKSDHQCLPPDVSSGQLRPPDLISCPVAGLPGGHGKVVADCTEETVTFV